ncbi:MAG TPA: hypothetical protein VMQ44_01160 [Candidatus Saccharimonadales bacterium]|nr:hypothetical protein [Candidatus Saccharimonadales bacterium]
MLKQILASDADGVFIDWNREFLVFANARLGIGKTYDDYKTHNLYETFDTDQATMQRLVDEFDDEFCRHDFSLVAGASEYSQALGDRYRFAIITSCPDSYKISRQRFFERILPGSQVLFTSGKNNTLTGRDGRLTKLETVRSLCATAFIDDNEHEFYDWDPEVALPICYAQPWNRSLELTHPHIPRLTWPEIAELLLA